AGWLQRQGLQKGARVALMMPNVPAYLACLLGTLHAGLVVVNVNPLYKADELQQQLLDSGAEVIVILENFARTLQDVGDRGALRHVVVTGPGDLLGGLKAPLVNFVARYIKRMIPAWRIEGAHPVSGVGSHGASALLTVPPLTAEEVAVL